MSLYPGSSHWTLINNLHSLQHRFMFMGILNAAFAPFIVLYLVMYSFFRYFEVSLDSVPCLDSCQYARSTGVSQEPISHRKPRLHAVCKMEVSRVQRTPPCL